MYTSVPAHVWSQSVALRKRNAVGIESHSLFSRNKETRNDKLRVFVRDGVLPAIYDGCKRLYEQRHGRVSDVISRVFNSSPGEMWRRLRALHCESSWSVRCISVDQCTVVSENPEAAETMTSVTVSPLTTKDCRGHCGSSVLCWDPNTGQYEVALIHGLYLVSNRCGSVQVFEDIRRSFLIHRDAKSEEPHDVYNVFADVEFLRDVTAFDGVAKKVAEDFGGAAVVCRCTIVLVIDRRTVYVWHRSFDPYDSYI